MKLTVFAVSAFVAPSVLACGATCLAFTGEKDPVYTAFLTNTAVDGYDPVSFFDGEGVKGSREHEIDFKGATFRFATMKNRERFRADPDRYAPQYGGYCAWAVSQGYTAPGRSDFASVHDGKLYLNYDAKVQETWNEDRDGFVLLADENWPDVLN